LRGVIAESVTSLIDRTLDEQQTSWILHSEDIQKLLAGGARNCKLPSPYSSWEVLLLVLRTSVKHKLGLQ
jgi:hypothetical protein